MNYPFQIDQNSNKSEILISYSRQDLQKIDFNPTKPHNPPQVPSYPEQQVQDNVIKTEKNTSDNQKVLKYQTQEEYHKSLQSNLTQSQNFKNDFYQQNQPLYQSQNNLQDKASIKLNTNNQYQKEEK